MGGRIGIEIRKQMQIWRKKLTKVCDFEKGIMGKETEMEREK